MLDFTNPEGSIKERALYKYVQYHKEDPEVQKLLNLEGSSIVKKYIAYKNEFSNLKNSNDVTFLNKEENFENNTSTSNIILPNKDNYTEEDLLKAHGYDSSKWKIVKHQSSRWNSGPDVLISSKIFVRPRNPLEGSPETLMRRMDDALKIPKKTPPKEITKKDIDNLLVFPISDLHYGLLSDEYTSDNVYNMKIAEDRLWEYIYTTLDNVNTKNIKRILITFGNDFFNCDNVQGTTVHGTPQDNEGSYLTIWDRGVNLGISIIDYLLNKLESVDIDVIGVQGNHDLQSSHAMITALYFNYKNEKRVHVDVHSDEKSRYYYGYGENLIGFGHETKIKECHRIMSSECQNWSNFKYRTMFLGHLHKEEVLDTGALVVRRLPILSGKSTWTDQQGFMSHPRAQSFVFNANRGLINIINVEIE